MVALHQQRLGGAVEDDVVVSGLAAEVGHHRVHQLVHLHVFGAEPQAPGLQPREVEEVLDQPAQPVDLPPRLGHQVVLHRLAAGEPPLDGLQIHGEGSERRAQLVRRHGEEVRALAIELALLGDVEVHEQPAEGFAGDAAHRHGAAGEPAMLRALQLDLVARGGAAIREDPPDARQESRPALRIRLLQLAPVDLVVGLPVHRPQRDAEDLLDAVRGHPEEPRRVEQRDPVRIPVEHRPQLREPAVGFHPLGQHAVALGSQLPDQARVADGQGRPAGQRVGKVDVVVRVPPARPGGGEQQPPQRLVAVEHRRHHRRGQPQFPERLEGLLRRDRRAQHLVGDLAGEDRTFLDQRVELEGRGVPPPGRDQPVEPLLKRALLRIRVVGRDVLQRAVGLDQRERAPVVSHRGGDQVHDAAQGLDLVGPDVVEQHAGHVGQEPLAPLPLREPQPLLFELQRVHEWPDRNASGGKKQPLQPSQWSHGPRPVWYGARPMAAITPQIVAAHGLSQDEYARIRKVLGRDPNLVELGIFSAMWSEHCSYSTAPTNRRAASSSTYRPRDRASCRDLGRTRAWST